MCESSEFAKMMAWKVEADDLMESNDRKMIMMASFFMLRVSKGFDNIHFGVISPLSIWPGAVGLASDSI